MFTLADAILFGLRFAFFLFFNSVKFHSMSIIKTYSKCRGRDASSTQYYRQKAHWNWRDTRPGRCFRQYQIWDFITSFAEFRQVSHQVRYAKQPHVDRCALSRCIPSGSRTYLVTQFTCCVPRAALPFREHARNSKLQFCEIPQNPVRQTRRISSRTTTS